MCDESRDTKAAIMPGKDDGVDEMDLWWSAREEAMQGVLGDADDIVGHATIPFDMGADIGGAADIIYFHKHLAGSVVATSELIGRDDQVANQLGNYELMICHRSDDEDSKEWGADIICRLAYYTCDAELNPGETMDIRQSAPEGSTITALLFFDYAKFKVRDRDCGLLLCMGITDLELKACREGNRNSVEKALKAGGVYPFTDLFRKSVV